MKTTKNSNIKRIRKYQKNNVITQVKNNFKLQCAICGWKSQFESDTCGNEIHHIIPLEENGTNNLENLILLCPNHHREVHISKRIRREVFTVEILKNYRECLLYSNEEKEEINRKKKLLKEYNECLCRLHCFRRMKLHVWKTQRRIIKEYYDYSIERQSEDIDKMRNLGRNLSLSIYQVSRDTSTWR